MAARPNPMPSQAPEGGPAFDMKEIERLHGERGVKIVTLRYGHPQHSLQQIGEIVGLTKQGVSVALKRISTGRGSKKGRPTIEPEKVERIYDLICLGAYAAHVAKDIGVSATTVTNYVRKAAEDGIDLRVVTLVGTLGRKADAWRFPVPRNLHESALRSLGMRRWPRRFYARHDIERAVAKTLLTTLGETDPDPKTEWSVTIQRVA